MTRIKNQRRTAAEKTRRAVLETLENRQLLSSTFYVATTGSDGNAGTQASPWATLQHAANTVQAGDTVDVGAGNYAGFQLGTSGTAGAPITFNAASGTVINGTPGDSNGEIDIALQSYVTINGFTIDPSNSTATRAGIWGGGEAGNNVTNLLLENNTISNTDWWGILLGFSNNSTITKNNISKVTTQHGIYCGNSPVNDTISFNTIYDTAGCGIEDNADGTQGGTGISTGMVLDGNIIYDANSATGAAINFDGVQNSLIENNVIYNSQRNGIALYQYNGSGPSSGDTIVNNTIDLNSNSGTGYAAIQVIDGAVNTTIYNNIMSSDEMSLEIDPASMSGLKSDYNVFSSAGIDPTGVSYGNNISLASWQAEGYDTHSVLASSVSGLFVNAAAGNFNLASGSMAIGAGTSTDAAASDINGDARPTSGRYDAGAMQYQGTPATTPPPVTPPPITPPPVTPPPVTTPTAPTANDDSYTVAEGQTLAVAGTDGILSNDTDPNGLSLSAKLVTAPANGSLSLISNGGFSYTPLPGFSGTDKFTYTADDADLDSAPATVTITVTPTVVTTPPPAQSFALAGHAYTVNENSVLTVASPGVLAGLVNAAGGTVWISLTAGQEPTHGALNGNENGSFTYTPAANFVGTDTFSITVTNDIGQSTTVTETITVAAVAGSTPPTHHRTA
jgi:parallel beta-helix repeat protein